MENIFRNIRWASTLFIIIIVWNHAHWSVALAITLISFSIESLAVSLSIVAKSQMADIQLRKNMMKHHFPDGFDEGFYMRQDNNKNDEDQN